MKKILMMIALCCGILTANAQREVGTLTLQPKIGINFATLSNVELVTEYYMITNTGTYPMSHTSKGSFGVKILAGVEAEYQLTPMISLAAGLIYSQQGCGFENYSVLTTTGTKEFLKDAKIQLDYINVPIVVNFYLFKGFALKAGIQPEFLVNSKLKNSGESEMSGELPNKKSVCFSIPVGASYEIDGEWVIDARYNFGLTEVSSSNSYDGAKSSVISLTVGYKFDI